MPCQAVVYIDSRQKPASATQAAARRVGGQAAAAGDRRTMFDYISYQMSEKKRKQR